MIRLIADGVRNTFYQLAGNSNHCTFGLKPRLVFRFRQCFLAVAHHPGDVGNSTGMHITDILSGTPDTDDFKLIILYFGNECFDKFRSNIKTDDIVTLYRGLCFFT